jgi:serine protease Do
MPRLVGGRLPTGRFGNLSGCDATTQFTDQTTVEFALIQSDSGKGWSVFISNPNWNAWIQNRARHQLWLVTTKPWQGTFAVSADKTTLNFGDASIDFMNSVADAHSLIILAENKRQLTKSPLDMKDSEAAIKAVVNCVGEHAPSVPIPVAESTVSGTAFFVAPHVLVTANHVVKECRSPIQVRYPEQPSHTATISGQDETNDLAVLLTGMDSLSVASLHVGPRLGEPVATYGFPYAGVLSSSGNFTLGNVTSLSGMKDDTRFLQTSAPVQPGNSGGPLLDMSGSVVGVVDAQLDALTMMNAGNSVPQNVNFAVQALITINFLSAKDFQFGYIKYFSSFVSS